MDCMEYMDQVVGNILGNIFEMFLKRNLKTDVTFEKMSVALVFFCSVRMERRKSGNGVKGEKTMRIRKLRIDF